MQRYALVYRCPDVVISSKCNRDWRVSMQTTPDKREDLATFLPKKPILSAAELAVVMGYPTTAALSKARQRGVLPVAMFQLPSRRGWFASTELVLAWLERTLAG